MTVVMSAIIECCILFPVWADYYWKKSRDHLICLPIHSSLLKSKFFYVWFSRKFFLILSSWIIMLASCEIKQTSMWVEALKCKRCAHVVSYPFLHQCLTLNNVQQSDSRKDNSKNKWHLVISLKVLILL